MAEPVLAETGEEKLELTAGQKDRAGSGKVAGLLAVGVVDEDGSCCAELRPWTSCPWRNRPEAEKGIGRGGGVRGGRRLGFGEEGLGAYKGEGGGDVDAGGPGISSTAPCACREKRREEGDDMRAPAGSERER